MSKTLLRVVQDYLTYVDGFQVDSIFDSEESQQAALIAEHVYDTIVDKNRDLQFNTTVRSLDPSGDNTKPCLLRIPSEIRRIHNSEIWYNTAATGIEWKRVQFIQPNEFLQLADMQSSVGTNKEIQEVNGVPFVIRNDKSPDYCTTFDDVYLVFDSYESDKDTTLQESKTKVIATGAPTFLLEDDFNIPLPERMLSGYTDTVIQECCAALRSMSIPTVARRSNQFLAKMQQTQKTIGNKMAVNKKYGRR